MFDRDGAGGFFLQRAFMRGERFLQCEFRGNAGGAFGFEVLRQCSQGPFKFGASGLGRDTGGFSGFVQSKVGMRLLGAKIADGDLGFAQSAFGP